MPTRTKSHISAEAAVNRTPTDPKMISAVLIDTSIASGRRSRLATSLVLIILLFALAACARSTPPGPNNIGGTIEGQASYLLLDWPEGLRIMIWDDVAYAGHYSGSSSSMTDPLFYQDGSVRDADGRGYAYSLESRDGIQADFAIDGVPYDLNRGKVFLVRVAGDETQIQQLDLELSGVSPTNESIVAFGRETPEIATLMAESAAALTPEATAPPPSPASASATGIPELDRLAAAILSNDLEARRDLVRYTTAGCTTADGLGGPPKCDPDQAEGTPVEYLPVLGPGEGVTVLSEAVDGLLDFPAGALYAAFTRVDEPVRDVYYPPGEYGLFFTAGEGESNSQFIPVHADGEGHIVRLDYLACPVDEEGNVIGPGGLNCSPEQIIEREAGELLLTP